MPIKCSFKRVDHVLGASGSLDVLAPKYKTIYLSICVSGRFEIQTQD